METHFYLVAVIAVLLLRPGLTSTRPNIVFILSDDLGFNDVGFRGDTQLSTPNIDALAYSGSILQNYYVKPLCTPSRAALMTGYQPIHTGLQQSVIDISSGYGLPLSFKTLPQYLKDLNYKTAILGKWHLGHLRKEYTPLYRGFDSHLGFWGPQEDYFTHRYYQYPTIFDYDWRSNMKVDYTADGTYTTRLLSNEAVSIIQNHNTSSPLFLYFSQQSPHSGNDDDPIQAPAETISLFNNTISDIKRRTYAANIYEMDVSVGKVVKVLKAKNMLNNTIIIFSSDNGGAANGLNGNAGSNWPLRGTKYTPWEGGVRASAFIWSPLLPSSRQGSYINSLMDITDWLPTLYAAAGGNAANLNKSMDGKSQWSVITSSVDPPFTPYAVHFGPLVHNVDDDAGFAAVRWQQFKLIRGGNSYFGGYFDGWYGPSGRDGTSFNIPNYISNLLASDAGSALASVGMTLSSSLIQATRNSIQISCNQPANPTTCSGSPGTYCLFDISKDPCEYNNLYGSSTYSGVATAMKTVLNDPNYTNQIPALYAVYNTTDALYNPCNYNNTVTNWADLEQFVTVPCNTNA